MSAPTAGAKSRQEFYAGVQAHATPVSPCTAARADARRAGLPRVLKEAERLREDGAVIRRVILDNELKREYQQFLQEHNRGKSDSDGRPDRSPEEIARWAVEHDLPEKDGHVQFPDARIVYEDRDGRVQTLDIEVETLQLPRRSRSCEGVVRIQSSQRRTACVSSAPVVAGGGGAGRGSRYGLHHHRQHRQERWSQPRSAAR